MNIYFAFTFAIAYAVFLSVGLECLLNLLGMAMAISPDSSSVIMGSTGFIAFCVIVGLLALIFLAATVILDLKMSEKYGFTKKIWAAQMIIAVVALLPMVKLWEILFEFLYANMI